MGDKLTYEEMKTKLRNRIGFLESKKDHLMASRMKATLDMLRLSKGDPEIVKKFEYPNEGK